MTADVRWRAGVVVACAIAVTSSLPACSSSSPGPTADPPAGTPEAGAPPPEAGTPEASSGSEGGGVSVADCASLCAESTPMAFTCKSASAGDFSIDVVSLQSSCSNYAPGVTSICSPSLTTINTVNLNYLEFDCDGQVRSNQTDPCIDEGSWSLSGSTLTFNVQPSGLSVTCTKVAP
jgi:hypothetical protein